MQAVATRLCSSAGRQLHRAGERCRRFDGTTHFQCRIGAEEEIGNRIHIIIFSIRSCSKGRADSCRRHRISFLQARSDDATIAWETLRLTPGSGSTNPKKCLTAAGLAMAETCAQKLAKFYPFDARPQSMLALLTVHEVLLTPQTTVLTSVCCAVGGPERSEKFIADARRFWETAASESAVRAKAMGGVSQIFKQAPSVVQHLGNSCQADQKA